MKIEDTLHNNMLSVLTRIEDIPSYSKVLLMFSGGIDSTVLLYEMLHRKYNVVLVEFSYGNRPKFEEKSVADILSINNVPLYRISYPLVSCLNKTEMSDSITSINENNLLYFSLVSNLAVQLNVKYIFAGTILDDWFNQEIYDANPRFFEILNMLLQTEHKQQAPQICLPFLHKTKEEVVTLGVKLHVPFHLTRSCVSEDKYFCGICSQCIERSKALRANNIEE